MNGGLLVVGATSGAGKSTVATGLCRALARRGLPVVPFKAWNMSNHSAVSADGGEVARSQAMQAQAAGVELRTDMNPVLVKPGAGGQSHLVVLGRERSPDEEAASGDLDQRQAVVLDALTRLRAGGDLVIAEGAGGAAEINLLDRDLANLPLARAAGLPAIVVVDTDRGGAFASAFGTIELVPPALRSTIAGVVFNRFRGDPAVLQPGCRELERRTGVPVLGVLPHLGPRRLLGLEDGLDLESPAPGPPSRSPRPVRVAAVRLPHLANPSDLDPFLIEPDVTLRWVTDPSELNHADLVVLPGSRATVADLEWMRTSGMADAVADVDRLGQATIVGLCAGYQMLGRHIDDPVEAGLPPLDGLGHLPVSTTFSRPKVVRRSAGTWDRKPVAGYQIRFGRPETDGPPLLDLDGGPEGLRVNRILGTSLHGLFDADAGRARLLAEIADDRDRRYTPPSTTLAEAMQHQHDQLADWLEGHLDLDRLIDLTTTAAPKNDLPGW